MGLPHFYFVFLAINFALNSELSSATRHRSIRASFLNKAEHLQSYVRNNSSSSGLRNGKDVTTEKHAFFALMPWQMRSLSDDRVLPARKKLSRRSRSPLSTSLSNFRREWIPEQTGLVLVGKTKREVRGLSKLLIDYDGLNRHTESYRQKLFGPHAVKPSLYPLPFSFTGLPLPLSLRRSVDRRSSLSLPPGPSSREHYQASLALVAGKSFQRKDQLLEHKHAPAVPPVRAPEKPAQRKDQLLEHTHAPTAPPVRAPEKPAQGKDQLLEHKHAPTAPPVRAPEKPAQGKDQLLEHKHAPTAPPVRVTGKPAQGKDQLSEHKQAPLANHKRAPLALMAGEPSKGEDQRMKHKQAPIAHHKQAPLFRATGKPAQGKGQLISEHKEAPLAHHKRAPLALMAGEPSKGENQRMEHKQAPIAHHKQAPLVRVTGKPAQGEDQLLEHKQEPIAQLKQAPLALVVGEPSKGKDRLLENNHNQAFLALVTGKPAQGKDHFLVWGAHVAPSATKSQAVTSGNVDRSQFVLSIVKNAGLGIGNLSQQENTGKVIFSDRKSQEQGSSDSQKIIGDGFQDHFKRKKNRAHDPSDNRRARWGNFHDQNGAKKNKAQLPPSDSQRTRWEDFQYRNIRKNNLKQNSFDSKQISWDGVQDQNRHMKKYEEQSLLDNLRTRREDFQDQNKRKKNQAQVSSLDDQRTRNDYFQESSESKQIFWDDFPNKNSHKKRHERQSSFDDQITRRGDFQNQNKRKKNQTQESPARKMIPWDDFQHQTSSLKKNHAHRSSSDNQRTHTEQFQDQNRHEKNPTHSFPDRFPRESSKNQPIPNLDWSIFDKTIKGAKRKLALEDDLVCLGMLIAGHKYFGFDPRKGNEVTWRYRKMGFYTSFPRPRLKKLHPDAVEACKDDAVRCLHKVSALARRSSILQGTVCVKKTTSKIDRPHDAGPYYPFDSALDLFRYRTSVSYFMCWHAIKRNEALKTMYTKKSCLQSLELNTLHEPFNNQKSILDFRDDKVEFQCAMLAFCPDPCYGRKTKGIVPDKAFVAGRDPGNPCRGLMDQTCGWDLHHNIQFEDLQRNRFNISCNCKKEKLGFAWNSKYHLCVDVDECRNERIRMMCGHLGNQRCQNIVGGFRCVCQQGFLRNQKTLQCEEHVKIPRPVFNHSLTNARHLQKMLQSEGSGTFLWKEIEAALGLSSGSQHYPGMLWLLCNLIIVYFHLGNAVW